MKVEILAVGTELLMGQIANTNAQYISNRLPEAGIGVFYHSVVGDNPLRLKECLNIAMNRADIIIMTGGLGPTQDDLTKETVCEVLARKLILHEESLNKMEDFFKRINRPMADSNKKQAYLPEGCIVINNNRGTAPGCIIEYEKKVIIMLPGPPSEMKPMFEDTVMTYFKEKSEFKIVSEFLRIFGIGESSMEEKLLDMIETQTNPTIAPYAKEGEVTLRVTARCNKGEDGYSILEPTIDKIKKRLGNTVYSIGDRNMEEVVGELLIKRNISIAIAESCTGGLVSTKLTGVPGISSVFNRAIISYSNESKRENLGVNQKTLDEFGAVSKETAIEMAKGVRDVSKTDIGLSITGVAGPGGGTLDKPVGLVYVALAAKDNVICKELRLLGDRNRIRNSTSLNALDLVRRYVLGLED